MEALKEEVKPIQKTFLKSGKNKLNLKKDKEPELMLSRIEEFMEYGKFKDRFIDTCVLKDLNKLFLNKNANINSNDDQNNDNNLIGFSIDTNNHTIFKFNKTPNKLEIERFILPDKKQKKNNSRINEYTNESIEKVDLNNISENKGQINFLKKFNDNYQSEIEESKKKKKQVNSNIITNTKKLKKKLKEKNAATIFSKVNINDILNDSKNIKKRKKTVKEKENKNKYIDKNGEKEEKNKDNNKKLKEEDNNNKEDFNFKTTSISRRSKKSKTRKLTYGLENYKQKKYTGKKSSNNLQYNNINKISLDKNENDDNDKSKKNLFKNNINPRKSNKSCYFEDDSKSKKNKNKNTKFRSEIYSKFNDNPFNFKNKLVKTRIGKNNVITYKKEIDDINNSEDDNSNNEINSKKCSNSSDLSIKKNKKEKKKTNKNINSSKILKFDPEKNNDNLKNSEENNSSNLSKDNKDNSSSKKDNENLKKNSSYKIRHVNNIYISKNSYKNDEYNNNVIKLSSLSVVKADNLVSLEYHKNNENINANNSINNRKKLSMKNHEKEEKDDSINNNDKDNNSDNEKDNIIDVYKEMNTNYDGKNSNNKQEKKHCKFFCCL